MKCDIKSLRQCVYCHNFCKFSCPSYKSSKDQKITQNQKNYLIYFYNNSKLAIDKDFGKSVYLCNDCKRCEHYCIYNNKDVLINNRYSKEIIFNNGLAPKKIYDIEKNLIKYKNIYRNDKIESEHKKFINSYLYDIYVYLGDYVRLLRPQIFESFEKILNILGIKYVYDENEISDGILALEFGMEETAKKLMKENFNRINKYKFHKLVVLSPESLYGLKLEYEKYGYNFNKKIMHYTEFLNDYIDDLKINRTNDKIKYFDSCKLSRYLKIYDEPRNILSKISSFKDFNFSKNKNESECCGGYISFFDKDFSKKVSKNVIDEFIESGSNILVTSCPLCLSNLKDGNNNKEIKIYDLMEYINANLQS